jgi:hypothetical protein
MHADLVLYNGRFYTLDRARPRASALAAHEGRITYVGDAVTARDMLVPGGKALDLKGSCVIPGLNDAHLHFQWFALGLQTVDAETPTLGEALARVAKGAATTPAGHWVTGRGWNHNVWGGAFPTKGQLDQVAPDHPVSLGHKSGHAMWVNSRALALAQVTRDMTDPPGGQIVRDASGEPTGVLLEEAMSLVERLIPQPTLGDVVEAMRKAQAAAHRAGLTGVHDFDGSLALSAYEVLHRRGELALRVTKSIPLEHLDEAIAVGLRTGFGDDWLRVGQVKMFADGALGPRTAWMLQGYDTAPSDMGMATTDVEALREAVVKANDAGLGCAIHAIGDRANREVLALYAEAKARGRDGSPRNRIEHVQLLHPDDCGRLVELGVIASMQPIHATSDMLMAERDWGQRCCSAYALKTQLRHGAVLALGSDCPVEAIDPLLGIHAAVTRCRADGSPGPEGWYPAERLSVEEAVRGFTWGPAYAAGMEGKIGTLEVGKLADLTILDRDIFTIDPMEIVDVRVVGTVVGGRFAWRDQTL